MAVPCGDERDYAFAKHFNIPIKNIFNQDISEEAFTEKGGFVYENSDFLNGLDYKAGTKKIIEELEKIGAGKAKVNYRLRDAVFSRQRYWGEPFPVYYVNGLPQMIDAKHLPIRLPEVEKYLPTEDGQPPLGNAKEWYWNTKTNSVCSPPLEGLGEDIFPLELNTMPGWAGSSWYWLRYMDAQNENEFASQQAIDYWQNVDLYIGGSEHATGHLLYSRFWNKFLKDLGIVPTEEPFQKLINQGMILGTSAYIYGVWINFYHKNDASSLKVNSVAVDVPRPEFFLLSKEDYKELSSSLDFSEVKKHIEDEHSGFEENVNSGFTYTLNLVYRRIPVSLVSFSDEISVSQLIKSEQQFKDVINKTKSDVYKVGREVEKMSKSFYNVVNPDDICNEYGADTLRLYEMFLGPLEQAKPWNTAGITGVFGFLKKLWRL